MFKRAGCQKALSFSDVQLLFVALASGGCIPSIMYSLQLCWYFSQCQFRFEVCIDPMGALCPFSF